MRYKEDTEAVTTKDTKHTKEMKHRGTKTRKSFSATD
jgi:hypothetical protein